MRRTNPLPENQMLFWNIKKDVDYRFEEIIKTGCIGRGIA